MTTRTPDTLRPLDVVEVDGGTQTLRVVEVNDDGTVKLQDFNTGCFWTATADRLTVIGR